MVKLLVFTRPIEGPIFSWTGQSNLVFKITITTAMPIAYISFKNSAVKVCFEHTQRWRKPTWCRRTSPLRTLKEAIVIL